MPTDHNTPYLEKVYDSYPKVMETKNLRHHALSYFFPLHMQSLLHFFL